MENNSSKLFKEECDKCENYGHRSSDCWGSINKNYNRNNNKTSRNTRFNGECKNFGKRGHKAVECLEKKCKEKEYIVNNIFVGYTLCGEVQEENNKEYIK